MVPWTTQTCCRHICRLFASVRCVLEQLWIEQWVVMLRRSSGHDATVTCLRSVEGQAAPSKIRPKVRLNWNCPLCLGIPRPILLRKANVPAFPDHPTRTFRFVPLRLHNIPRLERHAEDCGRVSISNLPNRRGYSTQTAAYRPPRKVQVCALRRSLSTFRQRSFSANVRSVSEQPDRWGDES